MEKVAGVIEKFCAFSAIERVKLFERTLLSDPMKEKYSAVFNRTIATDAPVMGVFPMK